MIKQLEDLKNVRDVVLNHETVDAALEELVKLQAVNENAAWMELHTLLLKRVRECVERSASSSSAWLEQHGYVGDSKLDMSALSHDALHIVFKDCEPEVIGAKLLLQSLNKSVGQLTELYALGFMSGAAFILEAIQQEEQR